VTPPAGRLLVEHFGDGRCRHVQRNGNLAPLCRDISVVDSFPPSVLSGDWLVGEPGCHGCGFIWVCIPPPDLADDAEDRLECPSCGTMTGKLPDRCACLGCGYEWRGVLHPDVDTEDGFACPRCGEMLGMVEG
jgi:ribosomal protein S27AE